MAQLKVTTSDFSLKSTYKCTTTLYNDNTVSKSAGSASTASTNITFSYSLPANTNVTGATVYATLGSPLNGSASSTINGVSVGTGGTKSAAVTVANGSTSVTVPFSFKCNAVAHDHTGDATSSSTSSANQCTYYYYTHTSSLAYSDVYLLIDYEESTTACGAPTACALESTLSNSAVLLEWSGATAGTGNAISHYEIQRCESSDGCTWGSWAKVQDVSTTATSGSVSVEPPETPGNYYKYRVRTCGEAGEDFYSGWLESSNTLRRDHAPLDGFTDETLTPGTTYIKALHMQELQDRVATLRAFYGLTAYDFTTIIAGQTSLAGWTAHVLEIREAIDGIGKTHADWLTITENKPRADVIQQLRDVVLAL